jgi:uncharacterized membrane protein YbhN (UPF0104 family)
MSGRTGGLLLRLAISAGLLALLFSRGGVEVSDVAATVARAGPVPLLVAFALYGVLGSIIRAIRWRGLVRGLGQQIGFRRALEIFLIGTAFNQVLPTGIGGDVVRTLLLAREGMGRARAASTVLVERAAGMIALLIVGLAALAVVGRDAPPAVAAILFTAGAAAVVGTIVLLQARRLRRWASRVPLVGLVAAHPGVARFGDSFAEYGPRALLEALGWSVVFAGLLVATNVALGRAFGIEQATVGHWTLFVPLIALSLLIPSIGGLGVREWSYVGLLGALQPPVPPETATALSITFLGLNLVLAGAGAVIVAIQDVRPAADP